MTQCILSALDISEQLHASVRRSYRLGLKMQEQSRGPRDILVELDDVGFKHRLLEKARDTGYLMYKDAKILVLPNLPAEALARQWALKPITTALMEARIWYKWSPESALIVSF